MTSNTSSPATESLSEEVRLRCAPSPSAAIELDEHFGAALSDDTTDLPAAAVLASLGWGDVSELEDAPR